MGTILNGYKNMGRENQGDSHTTNVYYNKKQHFMVLHGFRYPRFPLL
jgi:hypothetical protein